MSKRTESRPDRGSAKTESRPDRGSAKTESRPDRGSAKTEPPLLALYENAEGALALAVCGRVAWRCPGKAPASAATGQTPPPPTYPMHLRLVPANSAKTPPAPPSGPWRLLSDNQDQIHAVLKRTGIFDTLVEALAHRMANAPGGMAHRKRVEWMIRSYDRQHRGEWE